MSSDRPKLLRGHTAPVVPYSASRDNAGEGADSTRSGLQLDPSVLSAMHRMSLGSSSVSIPDYGADDQTSTQMYKGYTHPPPSRTHEWNSSVQNPAPRASHPSTKTAYPSHYPSTKSNPNTPVYPYHSMNAPYSQSNTTSTPQGLPTTTPHYFPPYILKSMGGTQQPLIEFVMDPSGSSHILLARLGRGFSNECLTVAARKGNILWIVADRWDREVDSKYEWQIQFDRDADMTRVHANFDNGLLRITVKRRSS